MEAKTPAVVLLSGGQDSTTVFYDALRRYDVRGALSFDYGQRHRIELGLAEGTAVRAGVYYKTLDVRAIGEVSASSLTMRTFSNLRPAGDGNNAFAGERNLPSSFTPGRNLVFFSLGAAFAASREASVLVTGVCQQDRSGYPDCRPEFVGAMEATIRIGLDWPLFRIDAPLLLKTKAETWKMAKDLGKLEEIVLQTNSCYEGVRDVSALHDWGYGCGKCGACVERARGYNEAFGASLSVVK